jgi:hypothetical protein
MAVGEGDVMVDRQQLVRAVRLGVLALLVIGFALTIAGGWSSAAPVGQVGYGPVTVPNQIIQGTSSKGGSDLGLWIGIASAFGILGIAGFFGYQHWHTQDT